MDTGNRQRRNDRPVLHRRRLTGDYNTGSDLFPQKGQDGYAIFNARIGLRGPDEAWGIEFGVRIFSIRIMLRLRLTDLPRLAPARRRLDPQYPGGRQMFSQFLAEPRTYGITLRGKF